MNTQQESGRSLEQYQIQCGQRWVGTALADAHSNWELFERHHKDLVVILEPYLKDSGVHDLSGNSLNPRHTLTAWLWKCAESQENSWIWDFCSHYQKAHLSRGLIQYCKMVIHEMKSKPDPFAGHPEITLDFETPAYVPPRYVCGVCGGDPCTCARNQ